MKAIRPIRFRSGVYLGGTALLAMLAAGAACAQTGLPSAAAAQAPVAMPPTTDTGIAEIVVTAQRRQENLQDVPIAITAATGAMLQRKGVGSTEQLASAVPSLTIVATAGFVQPRIRGIGNSVFGAGYESGVATYVDGVYIASAPSSLFTLNNIDRIEVLKGPQGTLFGRNATGGLIQIITRDPSEKSGGAIALTAGDYQTLGADAYVTGGLASGLAADFAAHVSTQGRGYGTNIFNGQDVNKTDEDINLRSSILWRPGTGTKIRLSADYEKNSGELYGSVRIAPGTGYPVPVPPLPKAWDTDTNVQPSNRLEAGGVSAHIDQDLGFASLVDITAYRRSSYHLTFDGDAGPLPLVALRIGEDDRQFSQELQLVSKPASPIKWVVGGYYFHGASRYDPSEADFSGAARPATPLGPLASTQTFADLHTDSVAGYAQATAPIFAATNLTLGARYTTEKKDIDAYQLNQFAHLPGLHPGAPIAPQSKRFSKPTWRASLDHRFSPDLLVYASYNRGFKSGGFNGQFPSDAPFKPEVLDAFEVGEKADLFDRHLRVNVSGFYYIYKDIQVSRFIGSQTSYYNGASAHVYGLDADIVAKLTSRLSIDGGLTLLHDRFTRFPDAVISTQIPTGVIVGTGSATGNRLPNTPDFSATISADYTMPLSFAELSLDASYNYNDGYYSQPDNILRQPHYNMISSSAALTFPDGVTLRFWGRNLADAKIFVTLAAGSFDSNAALQAPRTWGATVSANF